MASSLEEDLCCAVCHDVFRDPVLLSCSHSFCRVCLSNWWSGKPSKDCPVCKRRSSKEAPPSNLVLKNLCESFLQQKEDGSKEKLCELHSEKLKLFCLNHQQPVCLVCRDSQKHSGHRFRPIDEAGEEHKKMVEETLEKLKQKLEILEKGQAKREQSVECVKGQAKRTEKLIRDTFKKMHHFLEEEEKTRIAAVRQEAELKSHMTDVTVATLCETIRSAEEQLKSEDMSFLLNYNSVQENLRQHLVKPDEPGYQPPSATRLDLAKHLGNLTFNIWNKMRERIEYYPVILDPNNTDPGLFVSEDMCSVRRGDRHQAPAGPRRVNSIYSVLGSSGFNSGGHSWEVVVGESSHWIIGVMEESVQRRRGPITSGVWRLRLSGAKYAAWSPPDPFVTLNVARKPHRIRVTLDWERGQLSFYDADTHTLLHTFTHTFTERVFPFFNPVDKVPLRVCAMKPCVTVRHCN